MAKRQSTVRPITNKRLAVAERETWPVWDRRSIALVIAALLVVAGLVVVALS